MYKSEFDKHIQNANVLNAFVFFGESHFLIDMYAKMMSNVEDANVMKYYYDEYDFNSAKAHLSQGSLFGDRNILLIKSEKKIAKKELETFMEYCAKNRENIFIYAYYGSDTKAYANKKAFPLKKIMSVRFFHPKGYEAQNIIMNVAREKNVNIDKYTISHLLNIHSGDVALACNEIEKFSIFNTEITLKDVENLVYGLSEVNFDLFVKKLLSKQDILEDLQSILEHGEDEIRILTRVTAFVTQLYMFNIYIRVNGAPNAIDILGYPAPKFVVDEKAALSLKFKPNTYYKLHQLLLESELSMKSSHVDKKSILFYTLLHLQKLL